MSSRFEKTGYLNSNFKIFHLRDFNFTAIESHFHDFHKVLIFLNGDVTYQIEGRNYELHTNDIVFVPAGEVHKPTIHSQREYERIIIYISEDFLSNYSSAQTDLSLCLKRAHENQSHVLRVPAFGSSRLGQIVQELEHSLNSSEYANELYHQILFIEFMIQLNRAAIHDGIEYIHTHNSNQKIVEILNYLNLHLTDDISIDFLAETFYISRYHLMHSFKEETGYTIGNYLSTKRLLLAKEMIDSGLSIVMNAVSKTIRPSLAPTISTLVVPLANISLLKLR